jgi:CHAT domain-containing protein
VSLWDVQEDATAELMERFYSRMLKDGLSPSAALQGAQASMAQDPNPRFRAVSSWAGFVIQGEPR